MSEANLNTQPPNKAADQIRFVETHVHLWDKENAAVKRGPFRPHQAAANSLRYRAEDFIAETRFSSLAKWMVVEANGATLDPAYETAWVQEQADRLGGPHGFVARVELASPDRDDVLDRHAQYAVFRGVRDPQGNLLLEHPRWLEGLAELGKRRLPLCLDTEYRRFGLVANAADRVPEATIVIDHCGLTLIDGEPKPDAAYLSEWRRALDGLATRANVIMKIGCLGLVARDPDWTVDSIRPWVEGCVEAFGVDRVIFGTDWPLNRCYSSYQDVLDAFGSILADGGHSTAHQVQMLAGNAEALYRL
jgi:predicted TIM-barrel fold metal-dependent hydrolase